MRMLPDGAVPLGKAEKERLSAPWFTPDQRAALENFPVLYHAQSGRLFLHGQILCRNTNTRAAFRKRGLAAYVSRDPVHAVKWSQRMPPDTSFYLADDAFSREMERCAKEAGPRGKAFASAALVGHVVSAFAFTRGCLSEKEPRPGDDVIALKALAAKIRKERGDSAANAVLFEALGSAPPAIRREDPAGAPPPLAALEVDLDRILDAAERAFGLTGESAERFHRMTVLGLPGPVHLGIAPPNRSFTFRIVLPDGRPFDEHVACKRSSGTHLTTLNRILYLCLPEVCPERKAAFAQEIGKDVAESIGAGLASLYTETGEPGVYVVNALDILRNCTYGIVMHASRTSVRKTREAFVRACKGSLVRCVEAHAMFGGGRAEKDAIMSLTSDADHCLERLFCKARDRFKVSKRKRRETRALPTARDVFLMMFMLDEMGEEALRDKPLLSQARLFLSMLLCGFRSGQMATLRHSGFSPPDTRDYCLLIRGDDGSLTVKIDSSSKKQAAYGLRTVDVTRLAGNHAREFETHCRPLLARGHEGLFSLPTGGPLHGSLSRNAKSGENKKHRPHNDSVIRTLAREFPNICKPDPSREGLTSFTDLRAIFFSPRRNAGGPASIRGLIANAQRWAESRRGGAENSSGLGELRDLPLIDAERVDAAMAFHNMSSEEAASMSYAQKVDPSVPFLMGLFGDVKDMLYEMFARGAA